MSKLNRQSQHRPSRDTVKSKELADLRRENHALKKQVARNRKVVQRVVDSNDMFRGVDRGVAWPKPETKGCVLTREAYQKSADMLLGSCPCGGKWKTLELGPKTLEVCDTCLTRRVVKPEA